MQHIFFINSLVEGHLPCFQFLASMNKSAMKIGKQVPCGKEDLSGIFPGVIELGLDIDRFSIF